jgi:hypothetical protein
MWTTIIFEFILSLDWCLCDNENSDVPVDNDKQHVR